MQTKINIFMSSSRFIVNPGSSTFSRSEQIRLDSRCSLPSNVFIGGGNDDKGVATYDE
jgi:hypothetical protein